MFNFTFDFIKKLKRNLFPFYNNKELKFVFKKLHEDFPDENVVARFVGGCVRKHLTGEIIDDIDIATTLTSDEIKKKFQNTDFKVIDTGVEHGTVTLISRNLKLELTTLRKDVSTDGRHAEVKYIDDWTLDSERRDFTVNAIYLDINGNILDPQMGTIDLKNNNIKFIGDPQKRIEEDYLRIIRFIRFKIMYNSSIDQTTINAIKINLDGIYKISRERILFELFKILDLKNFYSLIDNSDLKKIFSLVFPELKYINRINRLKEISKYLKIDKMIILATLLIDDKNNHEYFSHKYSVSNKIKNDLNQLGFNLKILKENKNFLEKNLKRNIYINGKDQIISLNILNYVSNNKYKISDFIKNLKKILNTKIPKFHIDGKYLMRHGMSEGARLGKTLKVIEKEWIDNDFKISNENVLEIIKKNSN